MTEFYGTSPAMEVLPTIKAHNELSPEERAEASTRFVEELFGL